MGEPYIPTHRAWSEPDVRLLQLILKRPGIPDWPQIAETMGRTVSSVQTKAYTLGWTLSPAMRGEIMRKAAREREAKRREGRR